MGSTNSVSFMNPLSSVPSSSLTTEVPLPPNKVSNSSLSTDFCGITVPVSSLSSVHPAAVVDVASSDVDDDDDVSNATVSSCTSFKVVGVVVGCRGTTDDHGEDDDDDDDDDDDADDVDVMVVKVKACVLILKLPYFITKHSNKHSIGTIFRIMNKFGNKTADSYLRIRISCCCYTLIL